MLITELAAHNNSNLDWDTAETAIATLDDKRLNDLAAPVDWGHDENGKPDGAETALLQEALLDVRDAITGEGRLWRDIATGFAWPPTSHPGRGNEGGEPM